MSNNHLFGIGLNFGWISFRQGMVVDVLLNTPFYAYDGGHHYSSLDDLMKPVKAQQDAGEKYVWNVTSSRVTIHCEQAWITCANDGSYQRPGSATTTPAQWLESTVLEKQHGLWKIVFLDSKAVRTPAAAK